MKNLDLFSKQFLSISLGISAIIISCSLLIKSLDLVPASQAKNPEFSDFKYSPLKQSAALHLQTMDTINNSGEINENIMAVQAFGIGIREGNLYFGILYNNNTIGLHKAPADSEDVLVW